MFEQKQQTQAENMQSRLERAKQLRAGAEIEQGAVQRLLTQELMKHSEEVSLKDAQKAAREAVFASADKNITVGKEEIPADLLRLRLAESIDDYWKNIPDLNFNVAMSNETINSTTSTANEYFGWIAEGHSIISKMNDGFVDPQELEQKHEFLGNLDQRETELMTCLGLYQASNTPLAKQRYEELSQKLNKLREIRSAVKNATKDTADKVPTTQEEYEKAKQYYMAVKMIDTISDEDKKHLDIYHGDDKQDFLVILQSRMLHDHQQGFAEGFVISRDQPASKEALARKIEALRGRKSIEQMLNEQEEERAKKRQNMAFNVQEFMRLNQNQNVYEGANR